jgi:hypothetical protein
MAGISRYERDEFANYRINLWIKFNSSNPTMNAAERKIEHQSPLTIIRRLGPDPHANGAKTDALEGCPDLFELEDGDFLAIGIDVTGEARRKLPSSAGCGPDERIVRIPRKTLVLAKCDIPDHL